MKSIESKMFERINIDKIHEEAKKFLEYEEIKTEKFTDLYGERNIKKDKEYVERMEEKFNQASSPEFTQVKELATLLEAVIYSQAELSDWLGPTAATIKTSRYDDIANKTDMIAEFQESETSASYFALAIDATLSSDAENVEKKI